jgi:hypothetical protein
MTGKTVELGNGEKKPLIGTRLGGGLYVMLGEDQFDDYGELRYPGKLGIKFGRDSKDWVRMSYSDAVQLVKFLQDHKGFVNSQIGLESERLKVETL